MTSNDGHQEYVFKVRDDTRRYMDQILQENEKLRSLVSVLEEELEQRNGQVSEVRDELNRERAEGENLKAQITEMMRENRKILDEHAEIERQNNDLAQLYVASYRLHETLNRDEVVQGVQEIVANLIGSEEMAIFEMQNGELKLIASHGVDPESLQPTPLDDAGEGRARELIEEIARSGERYVADPTRAGESSHADSGLTACVPLKLDGQVIGAVAVFRLLSQKTGLAPLDFELFDLLATHAAVALYCSGREDPPAPASAPPG